MAYWLQRKMRLSVNDRIIDKPADGLNGNTHGRYFFKRELTVGELSTEVKAGRAFSYEYQEDVRRAVEFVAADFLCIDVDSGLTIEEALHKPLAQEAATLVYSSVNHSNEANRFRMLFVLDRTITSADELVAATKALVGLFGADPKPTSAASFFYGNRQAETQLFNRGLTSERLQELIESRINSEIGAVTARPATVRGKRRIDPLTQIVMANGERSAISQIADRTSVHCPFHDDREPSAAIYQGRNGAKFLRCFGECNQAFWATEPTRAYDFETLENQLASGELARLAKVRRVSEQYLSKIELGDGIHFVKSPKGTGKTQMLAEALPHDGSVLLVGHRKALLRNLATRLNINCYLDKEKARKDKHFTRRYAVCIDSIRKYKIEYEYDYIILDEVEQLVAHLVGGTLNAKRHHVFAVLKRSLSRAKKVIALDADLSDLSFDYIRKWADKEGSKEAHFILNTFVSDKGVIKVFNSKNHITGDIAAQLRLGKRCYVASDSKEYLDSVDAWLSANMPSIRKITITSDTTKVIGPEAEFICNPVAESLSYQLVLASPALSTEVDISFPGKEKKYDIVYGVFSGSAVGHLDCDQQISRVRHPGEVRLFLLSQPRFQETDPAAIREDLLNNEYVNYLRPAGCEEGEDGELFDIAIRVAAKFRSSTNRFKANFLEMKRRQGWATQDVPGDTILTNEGKEILKLGETLNTHNLVERLMRAEPLSEQEVVSLQGRKNRGDKLQRYESDAFMKAEWESFFRSDLHPQLIEYVKRNDLIEKVKLYELVVRTGVFRGNDTIIMETLCGSVMVSPQRKAILLYEAFCSTPIFDGEKFCAGVEFSADDLGEFKKYVIYMKESFKFQEIGIRADIENSPVLQLKAFLKEVSIYTEQVRTERTGERKKYFYRISPRLVGLEKLVRLRQRRAPRHEAFGEIWRGG